MTDAHHPLPDRYESAKLTPCLLSHPSTTELPTSTNLPGLRGPEVKRTDPKISPPFWTVVSVFSKQVRRCCFPLWRGRCMTVTSEEQKVTFSTWE